MSDLAEKGRRGERVDHLIIDIHAHLGPWFNFPVREGGAEGLVKIMDRIGVDVACLSAHASIGPDFRLGNDLAYQAMRKHPDRIRPYIGINPNFPDGCLEEVERCRRLGMKNIKIHNIHGKPYDCERYRSAYEVANAEGWVVLAHTWGKDAELFDKLASDYRNINFVLAHSGVLEFDLYVELTKKRENIYLDITTSLVYYGMLEEFVRRVGSERLLFGTDAPFLSPKHQIGRILFARISDEDKQRILGGNAKSILTL